MTARPRALIDKVKAVLRGRPSQEAYVYEPSHTVVNDYSEFSGLSINEIAARISSYKSLTKKEWEGLPASAFSSKVERFYGTSTYYICDILYANVSKARVVSKLDSFSPQILEAIKNHRGRRFLEFGGGTGVFCELVAGSNKNVTYLDIPGLQFDFAKWRFEKYKIPVRMVCSRPGHLDLNGQFDIIYTDAVMEHLEDPYSMTEALCEHLDPGGLFVMLVDLSGEDDNMPMHRNVDIMRLHGVLKDAGLDALFGLNHFASIWVRRG